MTLGQTPRQVDLFRSTADFCALRVRQDSIYALLHRECFGLFPDALFDDLFTDVGRRSIPPLIVAVVMVLQRIEGCSDREAVERFTFDARWKYAAGGLPFDHPGFATHRAGRHAGPPGPLGAPPAPLRADARGGPSSRPRGRPPGARLDPPLRRGGDDGHRHPGALGDAGVLALADERFRLLHRAQVVPPVSGAAWPGPATSILRASTRSCPRSSPPRP